MTKTSRDKIVTAARELIREKGFAATSMKDVADRVGLLKGSLYNHFPSKQALIPAVLEATKAELLEGLEPTGDWQADYRAALARLVSILTENRRCVGFQLAYAATLDEPASSEAVSRFFSDICSALEGLLAQGVEPNLAAEFARETVTAVEGATLWLALEGDGTPMRQAENALLARAEAFAQPVPDEAVRRLLSQMIGDWRRASLAERQLAERVHAAEQDLLTVEAALTAQISAESRF